MEYREIVAVTGLGGLFQLLSTKSDGAIVRNISDKTTKFISARLYNVTPLESIEIYTTGENVRLHEVFEVMKEGEKSTPLVDTKKSDNNAVKAYFQKVFPTLDEERVYVSDMKKILKWYELLKASDLLNFEKLKQQAQPAEEEAVVVEEEATEKAPAKKAAAKKTAKADTEEEATEEKKAPAKKTAAKKTAKADKDEADTDEKKAPAKKTARKKKSEE